MKLTVSKRTVDKKSELTKIRRAGDIPAVMYSKKSEAVSMTVSGKDFDAALRSMKPGHLPTTVFALDIDGTENKAVVKDIHYHPTTYAIEHLDFQILEKDRPIMVKVPVECIGQAECAGVKLGGFIRQVKRHITVRCMPEKIPSHFELDILHLGLKQSLKAKHIDMGDVECLFPMEEVVVTIAKR